MSSLALASDPSTQLVRPASTELARQVIAQHSKSFALASKLLPRAARDNAAMLYAWCRYVDDLVDEGHGSAAQVRPEQLVELAPDTIPQIYPRALLAGMAMDLDGTRYETVDDLITYAWRVAGTVGLMMTHVLGVASDEALQPAAHLGIAMQLTNVCRDVGEDWQRGRLYIPDELLGSARGLARELGGDLPSSALPPLANAVRDLLALADRYYRSADRGIALLPWRAALAVRSARSIYSAIGDQIARVDHDVSARRAFVPHSGKLARVAVEVARIAASAPRRLWARQRYAPPTKTLELCDVQRL